MSYQRRRWFWVVCTIAMGAVWLAGFPACVQSQTNQSDGEEVARTAWGDPDLRGIWNNATITPLQRPESLGDKAFLTAEEVAETEQQAAERHRQANAPSEVRTEPFPVTGSLVSAYNSFWTEQGTAVVQTGCTSLISDPPNGRLPPLTSAAEVRIASPAYHRLADVRDGRVPADGPEEMGLSERCLWYRGIGHISPTGYNNNYQFFQTPDHVVILQEHIHDVRYVPLDGRPHLPATIRQYAGDSRGHWDGDTLVVETTNIREAFIRRWNLPQHSMGRGDLSGQVTLVERFTRTGPDTLDYQFTVEDPIRKRGRSPGRVRCRWHVLTARSTSSRVTRATMRCSTCLLDRGLRRVPQRNEGNPMKAHDPMKVTDMDQRDARLCIGHNRSGRLCNKFAGSHAQTQY